MHRQLPRETGRRGREASVDGGEYECLDAVDRLFADGADVEVERPDGWVTNVNTVADIERVEGRIGEDGSA